MLCYTVCFPLQVMVRCVDCEVYCRNRLYWARIIGFVVCLCLVFLYICQGPPALKVNSLSGKVSSLHVPDKVSSASLGRGPLNVVIVYAFDCTNWTSAWYTVDGIFWMVQEKLTYFAGSCLGYIYVISTPNTYTLDMKVVDPTETKETGYTKFAWHRMTCTKNMASGLAEAHKMISSCGHHNSIILFFSDGLVNKGDFFDGTQNFVSKVPVHTFTLAGDAYNHVLHSIVANSPGGKFHATAVPERPNLSSPFSKLLDSLLGATPKDDEKPPGTVSGREPLDVVIISAFDSTNSTPAWYTVDNEIFWLVQEKLTHFANSCMGYIYVMSTPNMYTSDMKVVDPADTKETGYRKFDWRRLKCTKNMASGLAEAHKMISSRGYHDGVILFFSDGLIN
uniref:VWFA domain-containing protein n=4 Tax=Aegilops tauschii subsp. strangulata TaxID=200361 RepID=A0A453Q943_AEGTS